MSRGPGKRERAILEAVKVHECIYLEDLLSTHTLAEYKAMHRAARRLEDTGRVSCVHYAFGAPRLLLMRPGFFAPDRMAFDAARRRKVLVAKC